jgi:hypothetical protein
MLGYVVSIQFPDGYKREEETSELVAMYFAVEVVRNKEIGFLKASKILKAPRSTLENYVNHKTKQVVDLLKTSLGRKSMLPQDADDQIA